MKWLGRRRSVRRELILWNTFALAALFAALGLITRCSVQTFMINSIDSQMSRRSEGMVRERTEILRANPEFLRQLGEREGHGAERRTVTLPAAMFAPILYFVNDGSVVGGEDQAWDPKALAAAKRGRTVRDDVSFQGEPLRVLTIPISPAGVVLAIMQDAYPLTEVKRVLHSLDLTLLALTPFALILSVVGSALITGRVLVRIHRMSDTVKKLSTEDLSLRLPVEGEDEFSGLAVTLNGMLGRVQDAFAAQARLLELQRRFTADASHELRTPLTVIKGSTSLALKPMTSSSDLRQALCEIDRSVGTMSRLVSDLLILARSDGGQLGRNPIDVMIHELLVGAIETVTAVRTEAEVTLQMEDPAATVRGNESELGRLFANLIDNGAQYGKHVRVLVRTVSDRVQVTIEDDGPGIASEHLPHLGERFYRIDESRTSGSGGTGLGLSICKSIVEAHGGSMKFESAMGQGTTVVVELPAFLRLTGTLTPVRGLTGPLPIAHKPSQQGDG